MIIAEIQSLARFYPYRLWITPGSQEVNTMIIAEIQSLAIGSTLTGCGSHLGVRRPIP